MVHITVFAGYSARPISLPPSCRHLPPRSRSRRCPAYACTANGAEPLLLRVARGEQGERSPVWLMRQAGRYMQAFRAYSDKMGFRQRSESADIALELSLQPWRAFQPDGVIMFSDILTPLPAMGIEFDVVKGRGPVIERPIRSLEQVQALRPLDDPDAALPFIRPILQGLRAEVGNAATVLGFVGSPWTLAAYAVEGHSERSCRATKTMMLQSPEVLKALLQHLADALSGYICHQIDCGAQVVQIFDSWAHHLSPAQFAEFSLPYAEQVMQAVRKQRPGVPLIFHANGGTGKEAAMSTCSADVIGLDWHVDMAHARQAYGDRTLQGNIDPMLLLGPEAHLRSAVEECCRAAGRHGHILNLGHGVIQQTPEESVALFCDLARQSASFFEPETHTVQTEDQLSPVAKLPVVAIS